MNYFKNHCWCSDSNWGGHYDCQIILSIKMILDGGTYHDKSTHNSEWNDLLLNDGKTLKPEVIKWLEENIKDCKDRRNPKAMVKGWCIGSQKYIDRNTLDFNIFMQRRTDAMKFAKRWSKNGTFDSYFNYFTQVRKKYCPVKKRLVTEVR